eukprot:SAG31_NODE_2168_length_6266_cov_11.946976_5_plen_190_part_00
MDTCSVALFVLSPDLDGVPSWLCVSWCISKIGNRRTTLLISARCTVLVDDSTIVEDLNAVISISNSVYVRVLIETNRNTFADTIFFSPGHYVPAYGDTLAIRARASTSVHLVAYNESDAAGQFWQMHVRLASLIEGGPCDTQDIALRDSGVSRKYEVGDGNRLILLHNNIAAYFVDLLHSRPQCVQRTR